MVSVKKDFVLVIDIPRKIYEAQKLGYTHFEADFEGDTRRVTLRSWKREDRTARRFECPTCQSMVPNRSALNVHQVQLKHGPYALPKPLYSAGEIAE